MKISSVIIGKQNRDLLACSAVLQPTSSPRASAFTISAHVMLIRPEILLLLLLLLLLIWLLNRHINKHELNSVELKLFFLEMNF